MSFFLLKDTSINVFIVEAKMIFQNFKNKLSFGF